MRLVVSPHLDDAVMGAGTYLATTHEPVVCVFGGVPDRDDVTPYDEASGFASSREAMQTRRSEDTEALSLLGCSGVLLDHLDRQYERVRPTPAVLAGDLRGALARTGAWGLVGPLGIQHPDHQCVALAVRLLAREGVPTWLYEELPYRVAWPEHAHEALHLWRTAFQLVPDMIADGSDEARAAKEAALGAYRSQRFDLHSCLVPERFWRVCVG